VRLTDLRHRRRLRRLARDAPPEYRDYLEQQLERTLSKRDNDPGVGARILVGRTVDLGGLGPSSRVLCVGCRNPVEIELFLASGVGTVAGIDLFSQHEQILVMDMHAMTFDDGAFDAVYASHSLEHAAAPAEALGEFRRVVCAGGVIAIEVPVRHRGHDADLTEFAGVEDLVAQLEPFAARILWQEEQPARSETNDQGSAVARAIFQPSA
jgi:SAM-dependent methyltransferase